jgi:zinc protease
MHFSSRAVRTLVSLLLAGSLPFQPLLAQEAATTAPAPVAAEAEVPWLYENSDVPPDRAWNFGELDNGLRYAVRKNGVPPGQVSIRIRVDAGSLYETDAERGYAHLLEHLLFRQSKYIEEGTAIATFQRLGASFGSDTNAQTSPTQTVFMFDLPNATPQKLDESFKLLSGMITAPALSASNIRSDLPIVLSEMRDNGGAGKRVQEAIQQTFYQGQPLASRNPIGTTETLQAATPESVRAFYARWYRPENVTVIVAGDAEPAVLEAEVKKWFSGWSVPGEPVPAPSFGAPQAPAGADSDNPVGATKVVVEPDLPPSMMLAVLRPWRKVNDTIVYNQGIMLDSIGQMIINRRLESKARAGGSFLAAQVENEKVSRSVDATFVSITPLTDDWQAALTDVRSVIADATTRPPTQEEIDRELAELDVAFQVPVEQQAILPGSKVADDLVNALDIRETVAAPDAVLKIFRDSRPIFTPQAVLEHTQDLFQGTVRRALFVTNKPGQATDAELRQAMLAEVEPDTAIRSQAQPVSFDTLPAIGMPQPPVSVESSGLLEITQANFANGVKALLWPVAEEPGRVTVKVRFGGGYRQFDPKDASYVGLGMYALVGSGLATLDMEDLDRISTGRKLGFQFEVDDSTFKFEAETRPSDLADQLYLFAAKLDQPKWDENPFLRAKAASRIQYESYATSPQGVLNRDLLFYQHGKDQRYRTNTPAEVEKATHKRFRRAWAKALESGPIEVQIYGDFDQAAAIEALSKTFGALDPRQSAKLVAPKGSGRMAASNTPVTLTHNGDANQAAAVISWPTGGGAAGIRESRRLEVLAQLFGNRLLDALREKTGASYAPYVYSTWPEELPSGGAITAMAQVTPEAVPDFFQIADEIAEDLAHNPPTQDELTRVIEPLKQQVARASSSTAYFMGELEGATQDPSRFRSLVTYISDYTQVTPAMMQQLAAKYLGNDKSWRLEVLPAGEQPQGR